MLLKYTNEIYQAKEGKYGRLLGRVLDIIGLNQDIRQKAELKTLIEFPLAEPKTDLLISLFEYITSIYGSEKCTILWWYEPSCINDKNISNP